MDDGRAPGSLDEAKRQKRPRRSFTDDFEDGAVLPRWPRFGSRRIPLASFAKGGKHPNIGAAHNHVKQAIEKLTAAQRANEYDLGGHATKAKELLAQADKEIAAAREAANK